MGKKNKRVMAINLNDLGGKEEHLMAHKCLRDDGRYHIDWEYWANHIDKKQVWEQVKEYIKNKAPDILFIQEMLISEYESIDFIGELRQIGYSHVEESIPKEGNYSITVGFYKGKSPEYIPSPGDYRNNRSVVCKYGKMLLVGSHFPSESDEVFLEHMREFVEGNLGKDLLLIGDLNANNPTRGNKKTVNHLLEEGAVDLWTDAGNDAYTPTEARFGGRLDYAIASPSLAKRVRNVELDPTPMDIGITDHAAVIVDI